MTRVLLVPVFDVAIPCDPVVETIYHSDRFSCVVGISNVVGMKSWKAGNTLPFSAGSVTLVSFTVTL